MQNHFPKSPFTTLHPQEADLAAAFLPIIPHFWSYVRYSRSLDKGEWVVLMNRPPVSATGSGLLAPFTFQVWLLILVSLLLVGPLIYLIIVAHTRLCRYENNNIYPLHSYVWFVYGALLKQGSTLSPQTGNGSSCIKICLCCFEPRLCSSLAVISGFLVALINVGFVK